MVKESNGRWQSGWSRFDRNLTMIRTELEFDPIMDTIGRDVVAAIESNSRCNSVELQFWPDHDRISIEILPDGSCDQDKF